MTRRERRQRLHELRGEQQATAIHPVGERAAEQGDDDERHELDEPDQTDEERRSGQDEHLVRERDQRHLGPDAGDDPADREQAEIARVAKRARVHGDAAQAAHRPAAEGRHARRSWHSHTARRRTRAYHDPVPGDEPLQLVWFRRDLRIDDNPALAAAAERGPVACCFVLDPRIFRGPGAAGVRVRFMLQGLEDLDARLRSFGGGLHLRRGTSEREVVRLASELGAAAVHACADDEPFARRRDEHAAALLTAQGRALVLHHDQTAVPHHELRTAAGTPYRRYSAYARAVRSRLGQHPPAELDLRGRLVAPQAADSAPGARRPARQGSGIERPRGRRDRCPRRASIGGSRAASGPTQTGGTRSPTPTRRHGSRHT